MLTNLRVVYIQRRVQVNRPGIKLVEEGLNQSRDVDNRVLNHRASDNLDDFKLQRGVWSQGSDRLGYRFAPGDADHMVVFELLVDVLGSKDAHQPQYVRIAEIAAVEYIGFIEAIFALEHPFHFERSFPNVVNRDGHHPFFPGCGKQT